MTLVLYLVVLVNNWYFALKKRSSQIWTVITLAFLFFVMSGAGPFYSFHADYDNYYRNYYTVLDRGILDNNQVGYSFIMIIGNILGLPFEVFRILVIAGCLWLLYRYVIKRYQVNANYILSLYMMYAVIMDSEQFRNWVALTILLSGIRFLETPKLADRLKFVAVWIASITFHYSFVLYAPLLLVNGKKDNKWIKRLVILSLTISVIIILNGNQIPFQDYIIAVADTRVVEQYLTTQTNFGFLIPAITHGSSVVLAYWSRKIIYAKHFGMPVDVLPGEPGYQEAKMRKRELTIANVIFWINVSMLMVFPLYIVNVQFYRLMRSLLLITYVICAKASTYIIRRTPNILFNLMVAGTALVWLFLDLIHRIAPERLLIPFFLENIL
ncbi:EpsG family protein [Atopococcus tabaci]|uniref:EpsG family protein n=1 Tax=Atopococcus tabaci TaxID=269774 RepID=UPI00041F9624|nr:EpsG family protein [Atopococcus tabaci]